VKHPDFDFMEKVKAKILVVDDDPDILTAARVVLRQKFELVETESNPKKLNFLLTNNQYDVVLLDMNYSAGKTAGSEGLLWLKEILLLQPQQQVIMLTAYGDIKIAVEAMKHGAADFIVKPWDNEKLEATVHASFQHSLSRNELSELKKKQTQYSRVLSAPEADLIGNSPLMQDVLSTVNKVAQTDANVLLLGENGTGKELIARLIHRQSLRNDQPFVKVDVGSLTPTLFESELFGHKKGAFTDAREDRIGRMELAHGGTLFLDEVGNLPLSLQTKILSALQGREITPLGSNKPIAIDIRLVSATNLNIHESVSAGQFREDLLYRINTVEITLPPLRMRPEDIPLLATHFLKLYSSKYRKEKFIGSEALKHLQKYSWPGNVRELQHAIERAVIMSDQAELTSRDFLFSSRREGDKREVFNLDDMEKNAITAAIRKYNGNMSKVAKELGVGRTTLYRKMIKYKLSDSDTDEK
jgi:two-component system, NtrC family, response regulator HydG